MSAMGEPAEAAATLRAASLEAAAMRAASLGAAVAAAKAKLEGSDQNRQHTGPSPATMAATEALAAWQERQVECSEESGSSSQQQVEEVRQKELAMLQEAVDVMKKNQDSSSSSEAAVALHIANVDAARTSQDPAAVLDPVADAPPPLDPLLGVGDLTTPAPSRTGWRPPLLLAPSRLGSATDFRNMEARSFNGGYHNTALWHTLAMS
jgi:hypothetical protein